MNKHSSPTCQRQRQRQQGSIVVLFGGLVLVLTGFAVLAIDVGRVFIVRGELQNVADSAALAGANCLTRRSSTVSPSDCLRTMSSTLNWERAEDKAQAQLSQNQADNRAILSSGAGHAIDVGYWDLLNKRPSGGTLTSPLSTTFSPIGAYDKPAIRVTVRKADGQNGGPVLMLTRLMFGGSDVPMSATSVAVISSPGGVPAGTLIPIAIEKCLLDQYWDSSTNSPKLADSKNLVGKASTGNQSIVVPQTIGQPWVYQLNANYPNTSCSASEWVTFLNDKRAVNKVIEAGNPDPLNIGDKVEIRDGNKASGYKELADKFPKLPVDVTLMVVDSRLQSGLRPIYAFAGFRITEIQKAPGYLRGSFVSASTSNGSSGIGPSYGVYTPPRLAY